MPRKPCNHDWVHLWVTLEAWGEEPMFRVDAYTISVCRKCKRLHWITPDGLFDYTYEFQTTGKKLEESDVD